MSKKKETAGIDAYKEIGGFLHNMRCIASEVAFYDGMNAKEGEPRFQEFRELEELDFTFWGELSSPSFLEDKPRKTYSLENIEAIVSGKSKTKPQTLSKFDFEVWKFLRTLDSVEKALSGIPKKEKAEAERSAILALGELRIVATKAARFLVPQREQLVYATKTFQFATSALETCRLILRLDEVQTKSGSFYMSGALLRNKTRPHNKGEQLTLFSQLEAHELEAVTRKGEVSVQQVKDNGIVRGLAGLTSSEHRLLLGLSQLLYEVSGDTNDSTSKDYYTGHGTHPVTSDFTVGGGWPFFWIGTYELARICKGGGTVGGDDVKHIETTAKGLQEKNFLLSYQLQRQSKTKGRNTTIQDTLSTQDRIIKVLKFERQERDNETGELVQDRTEICIALNPLFRHGIESYFVEWPSDTIERLEATKEGKRIPEANWLLLDYLKTKSSNHKGKEEEVIDRIDAQTLLEKLYPTYMEQKRRGLATQGTEKALFHAMRAGFLSKWETDSGQAGQLQYILTIPRKW